MQILQCWCEKAPTLSVPQQLRSKLKWRKWWELCWLWSYLYNQVRQIDLGTLQLHCMELRRFPFCHKTSLCTCKMRMAQWCGCQCISDDIELNLHPLDPGIEDARHTLNLDVNKCCWILNSWNNLCLYRIGKRDLDLNMIVDRSGDQNMMQAVWTRFPRRLVTKKKVRSHNFGVFH